MDQSAWIALLFYTATTVASVAGQNCTQLSPGNNMVLSGTFAAVGDPPITVSCVSGYKLSTNELQKNITCGGTGDWSDTVGFCIKKACSSVSGILGPDMTSSTLNTQFYGDSVIFTCNVGMAFFVDYYKPPPVRVHYSMNVTCEDDPAALMGAWTAVGNCSVPVCQTAGAIANAEVSFVDNNINTTGTVICKSGYHISYGQSSYPGDFHLTATCSENAAWMHAFGHDFFYVKCSPLPNYLGCLASGELVPIASTALVPNGYAACYSDCKARGASFAAVQGSNCNCGNQVTSGWSALTNTMCDLPCTDYVATDSTIEYFCGGSTGEEAVYALLDGCYTDLDLTGIETVLVSAFYEMTCQELCRGQDTSHSILHAGDQCTCANATNVIGPASFTVDPASCDDTSITANGTFYKVTDLILTSVVATTCDDLYASGVKMNALYYLTNPLRKFQCYFKDGTACETGWIGNAGFCYYFHATALVTYDQARTECRNRDADIFSVWTEAEKNFLNETRATFDDVWADRTETRWYNGQDDFVGLNVYLWSDGGLVSFDWWYFAPDYFSFHATCEYELYNRFFAWEPASGDLPYNSACKKPSVGPHCVDVGPWTPPNAEHVLVHPWMHLTYCIQFCKGQQLTYALVRNDTCYCTDVLPSHVSLPRASGCATPCPNNQFQDCGGLVAFTVKNVTGYLPATSCKELEWYGMTNGTFDILNTGLTFCPGNNNSCPRGWLSVGDRCYGAMTEDRYNPQTDEVDCAGRDSQLASIETNAEGTALTNTFGSVPLVGTRYCWWVGLKPLSKNRGVLSWASGRPNEHTDVNVLQTGIAYTYNQFCMGTTLYVFREYNSIFSADYVCEKGPENVGCFDGTTANLTFTYALMTIQLCAETCRGQLQRYAYLGKDKCACATEILGAESPGACTTRCGGQSNQFCGDGNNLYTVLDLDYYEPLLSTCEDALYLGMFRSGNYSINGNITECNLVDGGVCPEYWLSINGSCYRHFPKTALSREQICRDVGATQTSLPSVEVYDNLSAYVNRIDFNAGNVIVYTGITKAAYHLAVYISSDGLLTDETLYTSGSIKELDLFAGSVTGNFITFNFDTNTLTVDGGVVCKENKYLIGCYEVPSGLTYIMQDYGSMEMGMCRQVCIGQSLPIFVMGNNFCGCINDTAVLTTLGAAAACDVACPIHANQRCGDGTVLWAYYTGEGDFPYAKSCLHLYKNGIFYEADYKIGPDMASATLNTCGFLDDTPCPLKYFGANGTCYLIERSTATYASKRSVCVANDSYLFNPYEQEVIDFVNKALGVTDGLFISSTWFTGLAVATYDTSYVASSGKIAYVGTVSPTSIPEDLVGYSSDTQELFHSGPVCSEICQKDPDYLGCHTIATAATESFVVPLNSLSQCSQLCLANGNNFAAVSIDLCWCFAAAPALTSAYGQCSTECVGQPKQMCGATGVFNVLNITTWSGITGTCSTVWSYGMTFPGWYFLRGTDLLPFQQRRCFDGPDPTKPITDAAVYSFSTGLTGYTAPQFTSGFDNAWIPSTENPLEFVTITLNDDFLITGVTIKGMKTPDVDGFVLTYSLQYFDSVFGTNVLYTAGGSSTLSSGCTQSIDICTHTLVEPFVTNQVIVTPQTWSANQTMQVMLHGQVYKYFDHDNRYVGCVSGQLANLDLTGLTSSLEDCFAICSPISPYAAFDGTAYCACLSFDHYNFGFVNEGMCPSNGTHRFSVQPSYLALYRTYDKKCQAPSPSYVPEGSFLSMSYTYVTFLETFSSVALYACNPGFLPPEISVVCMQNNTWSLPAVACSQFQCPNFTVVNGVVGYTHMFHYGEATVTCNSGSWADNSRPTMTVMCEENGQWTVIPTCSVDNLLSKMAFYSLVSERIRNVTHLLQQLETRSRMDCVSRCMSEYFCTSANYQRPPGDPFGEGGTCRLFNNTVDTHGLFTDPNWDYITLE